MPRPRTTPNGEGKAAICNGVTKGRTEFLIPRRLVRVQPGSLHVPQPAVDIDYTVATDGSVSSGSVRVDGSRIATL